MLNSASHMTRRVTMAVLELILIVLSLCGHNLASCLSAELEIVVSPDCANSSQPNCTDLDSALSSLESDTILSLEPGEHALREYHGQSLWNIVNISLIGAEEGSVRITCQNGSETGLVFIKVTNLVIKNVAIDGCGLTNTSLQNVNDVLSTFLLVHFKIPTSIQVGLLLAYCEDVVMDNCLVINTRGIGMLGINVIGNSTFSNTNFSYNIRPHCMDDDDFHVLGGKQTSRYAEIGGGAYFEYEDLNTTEEIVNSSLSIEGCRFEYNADCTHTFHGSLTYLYYTSSLYTVGGGGGLTIFTPQTTFSAVVSVSRTMFFKNDARNGAGAHIGLFAGFADTSVTFSHCTFVANGLASAYGGKIDMSVSDGGAGVAIFTDLLGHFEASVSRSSVLCEKCKAVTFMNTSFIENSALVRGGGILCYSLSKNNLHLLYKSKVHHTSHMLLNGTTLNSNSAKHGSGIYIWQRASISVDGAMAVTMSDVTVENGREVYARTKTVSRMDVSAVSLSGISVWIAGGNMTIMNNQGSGLHLQSSGVIICSGVFFILQGNKAHRGGGILMKDVPSGLIMKENSSVIFHNNTAISQGGAIYYASFREQEKLLESLSFEIGCFIFTSALAYSSHHAGIVNVSVKFIDNNAPVGSIIFGASLNACSWAKELNVSDSEIYMELNRTYGSAFEFSETPQGRQAISGPPHTMNLYGAVSSVPGQYSFVDVSVQDVFQNEIDTVLSVDYHDDSGHEVKLGTRGEWYHVNGAAFQVQTRGDMIDGIKTHLFSTDNLVSTGMIVNILDCPIGFIYDTNITQCVCAIHDHPKVKCNPKKGAMELLVTEGMWLGCIPGENCSTVDDLVLMECYFGHCSSTPSVFNTSNPDSQCAFESHRSGFRCSRCAENYSALVGDFLCAKCSNSSFILPVVVSILCGLFVMLVLAILSSTTDNGWLYMITFFSSVVFPYNFYETKVSNLVMILTAPARWLGLEIGYYSCLFDGLTPLQSVAVRLSFPAYLYLLMSLLALLWLCSPSLRRHFSPLKTLAALLFLTYSKISKTFVLVLRVIVVENLTGTWSQSYWGIDPNEVFFHGMHGVLASFIIFLAIIYLLPFFFLLLGYKFAFKYLKKFKPFLDALWEPYKPKFYIWAGVRLLFQNVVSLYSVYLNPSHILGLHFGLIFVFLLSFLYFQSLLQPFKSTIINVCDSILILLSVFMHQLAYYGAVRIFRTNDTSPPTAFELSYTILTMGSAYVIILLTFFWSCKPAAMKTLLMLKKMLLKLKNVSLELKSCCKRQHNEPATMTRTQSIRSRPTHSSVSFVPESDEEDESLHGKRSIDDASLRYFAD